jgi:hypothetical protein
LGITGRYFLEDITVNAIKDDLDSFVPMLYASTKVGLPFSGFYVGADLNSGSDVLDYQLRLGWATENLIIPEFGLEAGYRKLDINAGARHSSISMDTQADGIFLNLTAHF